MLNHGFGCDIFDKNRKIHAIRPQMKYWYSERNWSTSFRKNINNYKNKYKISAEFTDSASGTKVIKYHQQREKKTWVPWNTFPDCNTANEKCHEALSIWNDDDHRHNYDKTCCSIWHFLQLILYSIKQLIDIINRYRVNIMSCRSAYMQLWWNVKILKLIYLTVH